MSYQIMRAGVTFDLASEGLGTTWRARFYQQGNEEVCKSNKKGDTAASRVGNRGKSSTLTQIADRSATACSKPARVTKNARRHLCSRSCRAFGTTRGPCGADGADRAGC